MKEVTIFSFFVLFLGFTNGVNHYVYEFGQEIGNVVYKDEGTIPLLQQVTRKTIPVQYPQVVNYVRVTVDAIAPPKVDYDEKTHQVTIKYSWAEISLSSYTIVAEAI